MHLKTRAAMHPHNVRRRRKMDLLFYVGWEAGMHLKWKEEGVAGRRQLLCNNPLPSSSFALLWEMRMRRGRCNSCHCHFHFFHWHFCHCNIASNLWTLVKLFAWCSWMMIFKTKTRTRTRTRKTKILMMMLTMVGLLHNSVGLSLRRCLPAAATPKSFLSILRSFKSCLSKFVLPLHPNSLSRNPLFSLSRNWKRTRKKTAFLQRLPSTDKQAMCLISVRFTLILQKKSVCHTW